MKSIFFVSLSLVSASAFSATAAKIVAKDEDNKIVFIALDSKGTPRLDGEAKSYPSIKDFREDSAYFEACYDGSLKETKKLLKALVYAADGDGDSWAELESMKSNTAGEVEVIAKITDESGENEEAYTFKPCN